ncbi:hypothetical protein PLANTIT3_30121 [Plantibacter sp. T3]|nr:hypothetical protein PLANTIT3_30121 [Plantibacter sp. T3]
MREQHVRRGGRRGRRHGRFHPTARAGGPEHDGPRRRGVDLLRHPVVVEGVRVRCCGERATHGRTHPSGRGRQWARGRQRRVELHRGLREAPQRERRGRRGRGGLRRPGDLAPGRRVSADRATRPAPDLLLTADGPRPRSRADRRSRGRARARPGRLGLLRLRRRPRHAAPRADGLRDEGRGHRGRRPGCRRARVLQPHLRTRDDPRHGRGLPPRARTAGRRVGSARRKRTFRSLRRAWRAERALSALAPVPSPGSHRGICSDIAPARRGAGPRRIVRAWRVSRDGSHGRGAASAA